MKEHDECKQQAVDITTGMSSRQFLEIIMQERPKAEIDAWEDAIYLHPDMRPVEESMNAAIARLTWEDVVNLNDAMQENLISGIRKLRGYFWKLLELPDGDCPTMTYDEFGRLCQEKGYEMDTVPEDISLMAHYVRTEDDGVKTYLLVNTAAFPGQTIATLFYALAHEAWHAWQTEQQLDILRDGKFHVPQGEPEDASRAVLYALNGMIQVDPAREGVEAYSAQLIEQEAFLFGKKVIDHIQGLFSARNDATDEECRVTNRVAEQLNAVLA